MAIQQWIEPHHPTPPPKHKYLFPITERRRKLRGTEKKGRREERKERTEREKEKERMEEEDDDA